MMDTIRNMRIHLNDMTVIVYDSGTCKRKHFLKDQISLLSLTDLKGCQGKSLPGHLYTVQWCKAHFS